MAEFEYNNMVSATTGITPFCALYGQHPRYVINPIQTTNQTLTPDQTPTPTVIEDRKSVV